MELKLNLKRHTAKHIAREIRNMSKMLGAIGLFADERGDVLTAQHRSPQMDEFAEQYDQIGTYTHECPVAKIAADIEHHLTGA